MFKIKKKYFSSKAQASLEYISIFGIAFVLITITGAAFFSITNSAKVEFDKEKLNKIGTELIDIIQKVYFFGDTNRQTYKTLFPQGVETISIHHINEFGDEYYYLQISVLDGENQINLTYQTREDYIPIKCKNCNKMIIDSDHNVSYFYEKYLGQGFKNIRIEALNNSVYIDFDE
jgi:hypothetical protein